MKKKSKSREKKMGKERKGKAMLVQYFIDYIYIFEVDPAMIDVVHYDRALKVKSPNTSI